MLMTWPSDDDIQNTSAVVLSEVEQLLGAVGVDAKTMLAKYSPPAVGRFMKKPKTPSPPRTLYKIMQLYANMPMSIQTKDEVETCELASASEDVDKTMAI